MSRRGELQLAGSQHDVASVRGCRRGAPHFEPQFHSSMIRDQQAHAAQVKTRKRVLLANLSLQVEV